MTVFAGIIGLDPNESLPSSVHAELRRSLTREPGSEIEEFRERSSYIAHLDVGAFGTPSSFRDGSGGVTVLAGDPLIELSDGVALARDRASQVLHESLSRADDTPLSLARGTFALVHFLPQRRRLVLATDKIGIRPVFYWCDDRLVVFATQFRIIEGCSVVRKVMDARAATEAVYFGHALADRTPFVGIKRLRAGEVAEISPKGVGRRVYWRWDSIAKSDARDREAERRVFHAFEDAVRLRLRDDRIALSFLSGGLDSRCIAAIHRKMGVRVVSFDFSKDGSKDAAFARLFADEAGCDHTHIAQTRPVRTERELFAYRMVNATRGLFADKGDAAPPHPRLAWTGDNGSFSVGLLHLDDNLFRLARAGDEEGAVAAYIADVTSGPTHRLFNPRLAAVLPNVPRDSIREELRQIGCQDPPTRFYILYLTTALSRFLDRTYEEIDLHRLEYLMPFCDTKLIEAMISMPLDNAVAHRFYHRWLALFPPFTTAVPWQTYPTHEPCPVPAPPGTTAQWKLDYSAHDDTERQWLVRELATALWSPRWPSALVRRSVLAAYWLTAALRIGDHRFVLAAAAKYYRFAKSAAGRVSLESLHRTSRTESAAARPPGVSVSPPSPIGAAAGPIATKTAASKPKEKSTVGG